MLSIEESEVESWIIKAISTNILDARLDQLRRVAVISRATQRVFTHKQWEQLAERLSGWKENTLALLALIAKRDPASAHLPLNKTL